MRGHRIIIIATRGPRLRRPARWSRGNPQVGTGMVLYFSSVQVVGVLGAAQGSREAPERRALNQNAVAREQLVTSALV